MHLQTSLSDYLSKRYYEVVTVIVPRLIELESRKKLILRSSFILESKLTSITFTKEKILPLSRVTLIKFELKLLFLLISL
jgi:hypothetical protein